MLVMLPSEITHNVVLDSSGRITALPDDSHLNSVPLRIGDRLLIDRSDDGNALKGQRHSRLMKHAIETFGSEQAAREWLSIECGALNNRSPSEFINNTGNVAEVERILNCIDYGMIA